MLPSKELAKDNYEALISRGVVIYEKALLTRYLNSLKDIDRITKKIPRGKANPSYGYLVKENGELDFNAFVGVGDTKITSTEDFKALDSNIFNERGTLEGFLSFLDNVSEGECQMDFKMIVAASLCGVTLAYINNNSDTVAPPSYVFYGRTSIGKNLLFSIANNVWCKPSASNSLLCSSGSSIAFMMAQKDHLNTLPLLIADIQDLIDSRDGGIEVVTDIVFNHSIGSSSGKCTNTGEIRQNKRVWRNPLLTCSEEDFFTDNPKISGGADARLTVIPLNAPLEGWLTKNPPLSYAAEENKNAGMLGKEYIIRMMKENAPEVAKRFYEIVGEMEAEGFQTKQANSLALLIETTEMMKKHGLMPAGWKPITVKEVTEWVGVKKIELPIERMYEALCNHVIKDVSFPDWNDPYYNNNPKAFDWSNKTLKQVRGRLLYQRFNQFSNEYVNVDKEERERTLLLIPKEELNEAFKYLEIKNDIKGFAFNQKEWYKRGWLHKPNEKSKTYLFKQAHGIAVTRPLDRNHREEYYVIEIMESA